METAGRRVSPSHLSRPARDLWLKIEREYVLEPVHVALLTAAMEAWDRSRQARQVIDEKGLTYMDRFGQPKMRPEVKVEKDGWSQFRLLIRELGLDFEDVEPPRPPRVGR